MDKTEMMKRYEKETGKNPICSLTQKDIERRFSYCQNLTINIPSQDYMNMVEAKAAAYDRLISGGKVWEEGIMKTQESLKSYSLSNYPCLLDKFKVLLMHLYEEGYKKDDLISCVNTTYKGLEEEFGLTFPDEWEEE